MKILIVEDDTLLLQGLILAAQTEATPATAYPRPVQRSSVWRADITVWLFWTWACRMKTVCTSLTRIRQKKYSLPVLILTAR